MKKTTKFIALVLVVVLVLSCFCTAFAGGTITFPDFNIDLGVEFDKLAAKIGEAFAPSALDQFTNNLVQAIDLGKLGTSLGSFVGGLADGLTKFLDAESFLGWLFK